MCQDCQGLPVAEWLNAHGVAAILLQYRLPEGRSFVPLLDAQRAIRTTRAKATEWRIDPRRVGILGFSAGGHAASTAGTHFDAGRVWCTHSPQIGAAYSRQNTRYGNLGFEIWNLKLAADGPRPILEFHACLLYDTARGMQ
jgi:acetyl esterase/lipase